MSGLNRLGLAVFLLALCGALGAQSLPDIGQAQIEDFKLSLLDEKLAHCGTLTGKRASKDRAGKISVEGAELKLARPNGDLKLTSARFTYAAGTSSFECPEGFTADLPDGGLLTVPKGAGSLTLGAAIALNATCEGLARLRMGSESSSPLDVKLPDPQFAIAFNAQGQIESVVATSRRGADLLARLARLPSLPYAARGAAMANLTCMGVVTISLDRPRAAGQSAWGQADISLQGKVRGNLVQDVRTFDLSCNTLRIMALNGSQGLAPSEVEADGNARLAGNDCVASAANMLLLENAQERRALLTGDAVARFQRGEEVLDIRAARSATLTTPAGSDGGDELGIRLAGSAVLIGRKMQISAGSERLADWEAQGEQVFCRRLVLFHGPFDAACLAYDYEISGRGYAPLLRLFDSSGGYESLTVYGKSAAGSLVTGSDSADALGGTCSVEGPDILVTALGAFSMLQDLRRGSGLRQGELLAETRVKRPGRVVLRSARTAEFSVRRSGGAIGSLSLQARGEAYLRQEPLERNDRELVTLLGESVQLSLADGEIESALIEPGENGQARATLGLDLIQCRRFTIEGSGGAQVSTMAGPGRVTIRDPDTLQHLHSSLTHLRAADVSLLPDAAWAVFGGDAIVVNRVVSQSFDLFKARLVFVHGAFEPARSGPAAFEDLDELEADDVKLLYEARCSHLHGDTALTKPDNGQRTLTLSLLLTGLPLLRSEADGLLATAEERIEIEASHVLLEEPGQPPRRYSNGTGITLHRNARVTFSRASRFFDESGKIGQMAYDGSWRVSAGDMLKVLILPAAPSLQALRDRFTSSGASGADFRMRLEALHQGQILTSRDRARIARASDRSVAASRAWDLASLHLSTGHFQVGQGFRRNALGLEAAALAELGPDIWLEALGQVEVQLRSQRAGLMPVFLNMTRLEVGFDSLGSFTGLTGEGPVRISRGRYALSGKFVSQNEAGALLLEGARVTLPVETGVEIEGIESLLVLSRGAAGPRVRVVGRRLNIRASLAASQPAEKR